MPPDSKEQVRDKMARAVSLFGGNDPYSAWGKWLINLLIDQTARADEAEFKCRHSPIRKGDRAVIYCTVCLEANISDTRHFWTKADWLAAAKKDLGVE